MNLPVIFSKTLNTIKRLTGNGWLLAKKHAPEIMIGTGVVGFGATIYSTVKATNKTNDITDEAEAKKEQYEKLLGFEGYSIDDYNEDCKTLRRRTRRRIIRAWLPVGTLGAGSVISILGGYKIINGRYVATVAAYKLLEAETNRYRENVVERYGEQVDWELANDIKAEKLEAAKQEQAENTKIAEENKKKKLCKKAPKTAYHDIYAFRFDPHSERWQRYWNGELMLDFLQNVNSRANDKLRLQGHIFWNEILDMLGMPRTPEGAICGYVINKEHPNTFVDIGVDSMPEDEIRRILGTHRNEDLYVNLHPNIQGIMYDLI